MYISELDHLTVQWPKQSEMADQNLESLNYV